MIVLGLTGSIAMGKSTAARFFRYLGVPVHEADEAVHQLYETDRTLVAALEEAFPDVTGGGGVNRRLLGERVLGDPDALARLEALVHPAVARDRDRFLKHAACHRIPLVVLSVPLLFETGGDAGCDAVAVVSAPVGVQRRRALARPGMTPERLDAILDRQVSDGEKRARADAVIRTGCAFDGVFDQVRDLVSQSRSLTPRFWRPGCLRHNI